MSQRKSFFQESNPQQTGTGLLIRHGEVATTSGSTNFNAGWSSSNSSLFDSDVDGASPSPATNFHPVMITVYSGEDPLLV